MAETVGETLREIADMIDGLQDVCVITSRAELTALVGRLRVLAERERPLHLGGCDSCGSRLVFRGRQPRCPLGCHEVGP